MQHQRVARILVCSSVVLIEDNAVLKRILLEWYASWKNRGYLAPESISKMPIVQERWRQLSEQLTRFRSEEFAKR
jgi:large subunit ribosomal protein L15